MALGELNPIEGEHERPTKIAVQSIDPIISLTERLPCLEIVCFAP
jgi:hypothetical protein